MARRTSWTHLLLSDGVVRVHEILGDYIGADLDAQHRGAQTLMRHVRWCGFKTIYRTWNLVSTRTSKTNSDTTKASRRYRSTLRRCTFRYGRDSRLHRYRQHCTWTRDTKKMGVKGLFGITRMMIEGNSEIKNVFPADVATSLWGKPVLLKEQAIK